MEPPPGDTEVVAETVSAPAVEDFDVPFLTGGARTPAPRSRRPEAPAPAPSPEPVANPAIPDVELMDDPATILRRSGRGCGARRQELNGGPRRWRSVEDSAPPGSFAVVWHRPTHRPGSPGSSAGRRAFAFPAMHNAAFAAPRPQLGVPGCSPSSRRGSATRCADWPRPGCARSERDDSSQAFGGRVVVLARGVTSGRGDRCPEHAHSRRRGRVSRRQHRREGFLSALDERGAGELMGARVLLIGAGGAGRAVAYAVRLRGGTLLVANRTPGRAAELGASVPFTAEALNDAAAGAPSW